jgi:hypothetical protein
MTALLRSWWPALPALLILWFGGAAFVEKYPRRADSGKTRSTAFQGQDSLLLQFKKQLESDRRALADTGTRAAVDNVFRPIRPPRPEGASRPGAMTVPPPPRRFQLKGTVGRNVATILDGSGRKQILKVGDTIDSAEVIAIEPNKVTLKDRAGRFELLPER